MPLSAAFEQCGVAVPESSFDVTAPQFSWGAWKGRRPGRWLYRRS